MFIKHKNFTQILFIVLIGLIPLGGLFQHGLPWTHDGQDHVARIANFYQSLSDGVLVPRWGGNLNWGFGHPVMMFLYPLPSYLASAFHFLGFSLIDSLKLVFGFTFILSGIGMYLWVGRFLGTYSGIMAALLYIFAPYRFVNLYVRGAIGEHVAFAFIPFVLFFITKLFLDKKSKYGLFANFLGIGISTAALILSHNALSILFLFFAAFYTLILFLSKKELVKSIFVFFGVVYGFLLSAFFWVPAYIEGKYTLRDIVTGGAEYADRFVVSPLRFIAPTWSYGITGQLSVQVGVVHIALIILGFFILLRLKKDAHIERRIYILTFVFFIISLFMMLRESNFIWSTIGIIQKFQFPWRFLSLTVLTSAVLGSYFIYKTKVKKKALFVITVTGVIITLFYSPYMRANGYILKSDSFFKNTYHGTTDTGESSPVWSIRFMEEEPKSHIEVISGEAKIEEVFRNSVRHEYVITSDESIQIKENTLYFPGWNVYVNDRKLDLDSEVEFQNRLHRGLITFRIDKGVNKVRIEFEDTKLRFLANTLSFAALIFIMVSFAVLFYKKKRK